MFIANKLLVIGMGSYRRRRYWPNKFVTVILDAFYDTKFLSFSFRLSKTRTATYSPFIFFLNIKEILRRKGRHTRDYVGRCILGRSPTHPIHPRTRVRYGGNYKLAYINKARAERRAPDGW